MQVIFASSRALEAATQYKAREVTRGNRGVGEMDGERPMEI
jgi:hypothetical protein